MTPLATSAALHLTLVVVAALVRTTLAAGIEEPRAPVAVDDQIQHIVFLAPERLSAGGGGGGGGNREPGPMRRAQGVGTDAITLRVRRPSPITPVAAAVPPAIDDVPPLPSVVLDARPLSSGLLNQIGLPTGGVSSSASLGPGSGGGVGTGRGTGIGSGEGPGLGPGSGGGIGGGLYRPGGAVSAPRLITQVRPRYTDEALLHKIQGTVWLEAVVTREGRPSHIRVIRSLDRGLDDEAVAAVTEWRFAPGRLGDAPVDVLVTIMVDFLIR